MRTSNASCSASTGVLPSSRWRRHISCPGQPSHCLPLPASAVDDGHAVTDTISSVIPRSASTSAIFVVRDVVTTATATQVDAFEFLAFFVMS